MKAHKCLSLSLSLSLYIYIYNILYIYNGILLNHKKNEILLFETTGMDLEGIMLAEMSQKEKDKYYMISLLCGI